MLGLSNIFSVFLYDTKTANLKILFAQRFKVQRNNHHLLNKFIIYKFNQYIALNVENYSF